MVDREDLPTVDDLEVGVVVAQVRRGAAQGGRAQEEPVDAGTVRDGPREHQVEQQFGVGGAGTLGHPAQELPLLRLAEVVDDHAGGGLQRGHGARVLREPGGVGGVDDEEVHLDPEVRDGVGRFLGEFRDGAGAGAHGGQGETDSLHGAGFSVGSSDSVQQWRVERTRKPRVRASAGLPDHRGLDHF